MLVIKHIQKLLLKSCILAVALVFVTTSCKQTNGGANEGIIEFETKGVDESHPLYGLAPNSATLKFKEDKFAIEMSTMGIFNTTIIGDLKAKTLAQTVKFMDIKMACIENEKDIDAVNKDFEIKYEETKETKKIANYTCKKIKVTMVKNPTITFDAWYTKDLGLPNCNDLTPYKGVPGVLMDYRIKKMGLEMHFVAKSVKNNEVTDNTFEIPAYMKIVSKEEMAKFFADLQ